jgi:chemotaxis protein methyltransferase CheR
MIHLVGPAQIDRFREIIARRLGLHFDEGRIDHLADVLRERMDATGSPDIDAYVERLNSTAKTSQEFRTLAQALTVVETFFFRNADNFRAFTERVLPDRIRAQASTKRLRILSAGCASGDEAYSVAILVREALPDLASWDVQITGIDINLSMLTKATRARYSAWSLRATSDDAKRRYFRADGRDFILEPAIQQMVTFEERNLVDDDPVFWATGYDIVFCRNVIMYFTPEVMRHAISMFSGALLPDGYLFLGHAETLRGLSNEFHLCHTHDTFYYQRREGSAVSPDGALSERPLDATTNTVSIIDVESTAPWIDIIQKASERIAALGNDRERWTADDPSPLGVVAAPRMRTWDLAPVFEAMRRERFSDALQLLSALPPDSHDEPDAMLLRAALLTNSGQLDEAEDMCARLLAREELNAGAHYLMALCREHAGDATAAMEHDQTAVYLDASFAMPHLHLGLLARRSGDAAAARRELGQALILLAREDASRLLLFGGGFSRETLLQLCRAELRAAEGDR